MRRRQSESSLRRLEARLWTGPLAHLLGGGLDLIEALSRAAWQRLRRDASRHRGAGS